ncbi:hypothetical protein FQN60_000741 [Etheostoma spectabile]|uniref:Uncharacterized protein n=1 Tax=Etheostoma spectabile TaxID=54343 RepID=A0A5J5D2X4_9PERO|nr:hypothetical protein FQN60_000741 [Etheostoma spectabile]
MYSVHVHSLHQRNFLHQGPGSSAEKSPRTWRAVVREGRGSPPQTTKFGPHHTPIGSLNTPQFYNIVKASTTMVSVKGSPAAQVCGGMDMLSMDCSHAAKSNTTGRRQWRNAVRSPPVAARAQLNVSDDMTLACKNAHSSSTVLSDMVMPLGWSLALQ